MKSTLKPHHKMTKTNNKNKNNNNNNPTKIPPLSATTSTFDPTILQMINPNAAGIDVASEEMWVCVPADRAEPNVRMFGAFTDDLEAIADWLTQCRITSVAMESTGVYWIPLYQVLEQRGFAVCLTNARHLKNVAGRLKTDRLDCQWIQRLHSYGFLKASFRPKDDCSGMTWWHSRRKRFNNEISENKREYVSKITLQNRTNLSSLTDTTSCLKPERALVALSPLVSMVLVSVWCHHW